MHINFQFCAWTLPPFLTEQPGRLPGQDFLIDEYMVYEARVYGADTVLLIVAVLEEPLLRSLIACSRSLGMEPLVEVNNDAETKMALSCGARIIGVNNRNLHNFSVDASTTEVIMQDNAKALEEADCMLCALSGIQCRTDVQRYTVMGVEMVIAPYTLSAPIYRHGGRDGNSTLHPVCSHIPSWGSRW
jgi:anthranilate synthase/indole-3-glycerol phosphate synthase/phosphoribosylanthranilate isomerase